VVLPHAVDDAAPGECVVGVGDPLGEGGAPLRFGGFVEVGEGEAEVGSDGGEGVGCDGFARLFDVSSSEEVDGSGFSSFGAGPFEAAGAGVNGSGVDLERCGG
jgi:hypothetical protein